MRTPTLVGAVRLDRSTRREGELRSTGNSFRIIKHVLFRVRSGFFGEALEESCIDNVAVKRRRARGKRVETNSIASSSQAQEQRELLEEMGVNLLSDNSNSCDSHVPPPAVPSFQVSLVVFPSKQQP